MMQVAPGQCRTTSKNQGRTGQQGILCRKNLLQKAIL